MPDIEKIPEVLQNAENPYHYVYDNLPLENILARQRIINLQVDNNSQDLRLASGTAGTLSNRINVSVASDGSLKVSQLDAALHSIGAHADGEWLGVEYVRMTQDERDKLDLISDEATALLVQFNTVSTDVLFTDTTVEFEDSDTVSWSVTAPNKVKANLGFPASAAHQHFYDRIPANVTPSIPNYTDFKSTSVATPFTSGTLRVYVNGVRIPEGSPGVYVPPASGPNGTWKVTYFSATPTSGTFSLNRAITASDVIRIDFDTDFS